MVFLRFVCYLFFNTCCFKKIGIFEMIMWIELLFALGRVWMSCVSIFGVFRVFVWGGFLVGEFYICFSFICYYYFLWGFVFLFGNVIFSVDFEVGS